MLATMTVTTKKRLLIVLFALGVLMTLCATGVFYFSRAAPAWWHAAGRLPGDAEARAAALERGATTAIHAVREPGEAWAVSLDEADANAWLRHRLAAWMANRGARPPGFEPRVRFEDGRLRLGIGMEPRRVMWMVLDASFVPPSATGEPPRLRLTLADTGVGRLPVPSVFVRRVVEPVLARALTGWLVVEDHAAMAVGLPSLELADGRRVRVEELSFEAGRLVVRCVTDR
jgi:hypothetical protein